MAEKSVFQVDLPEGLKNKLSSLQRKLFVVDTAIALSGLIAGLVVSWICLLYTSPSPRDRQKSRMPSSA